jgi:hypothetical protein
MPTGASRRLRPHSKFPEDWGFLKILVPFLDVLFGFQGIQLASRSLQCFLGGAIPAWDNYEACSWAGLKVGKDEI